MKAGFGKELETLKQQNRVDIETLKLNKNFENDKALQVRHKSLNKKI